MFDHHTTPFYGISTTDCVHSVNIAQVKFPKFCTFFHAPLFADESHQRLLSKRRNQFARVEILPPALPFLALLSTERRHEP